MNNILLLGNGFDLAHGLPTRYIDFLEWIKAEYELYVNLRVQKADIVANGKEIKVDWPIASYPSEISVERIESQTIQLELWECIDKNVWIDYFLNNLMYQKENWIDFEREISRIIKSIDNDMQDCDFYDNIVVLSNDFLKKRFTITPFKDLFCPENVPEISYAKLRDTLLGDLVRLIRALEIYLTAYVGKMKVSFVSPDINSIHCDKVISFNYTDTYSKIYHQHLSHQIIQYDYIHGKAHEGGVLNNMVLGIDEYLTDKRKNIDTEFIAFKKFYQRIHKGTGCKYKDWVEEIKQKGIEDRKNKKFPQKANLYIFGHSLDITDGDILRDLILCDDVHTIIYYLDKEIHGQQIANLVKVIGQDELIRRTGGNNKTIEFKEQQGMVTRRNVDLI